MIEWQTSFLEALQAFDLATFLGRSTQAAFCGRYELSHTSRQWEDQQGRGFSTAVHLWLSNWPVTPCGT